MRIGSETVMRPVSYGQPLLHARRRSCRSFHGSLRAPWRSSAIVVSPGDERRHRLRCRTSRIDLAYERFGAPDAPPVLLVMGLGNQMLGWPEGFCSALDGRGLHVIRFDNRDVGLSTHRHDAPPPDVTAALSGDTSSVSYTLSDMAADSVALLDALELDSAHIVGASGLRSGCAGVHDRAAHRRGKAGSSQQGPRAGGVSARTLLRRLSSVSRLYVSLHARGNVSVNRCRGACLPGGSGSGPARHRAGPGGPDASSPTARMPG